MCAAKLQNFELFQINITCAIAWKTTIKYLKLVTNFSRPIDISTTCLPHRGPCIFGVSCSLLATKFYFKSQQVLLQFHVQIRSNIQVNFAPKSSLPIRFGKYNQRHRRTGRHFTGGGEKFALKRGICTENNNCPKNKQLHLKLTL